MAKVSSKNFKIVQTELYKHTHYLKTGFRYHYSFESVLSETNIISPRTSQNYLPNFANQPPEVRPPLVLASV